VGSGEVNEPSASDRLGMGVTFSLVGVTLVLIVVTAPLRSGLEALLLAVAAVLAGIGGNGVLSFFNHRRGGRSFGDWGVAAVLAGLVACVAVIWQALRPSGFWLFVLLVIGAVMAFFVLVAIGIGAGNFMTESAERRKATTAAGKSRRGGKGPRAGRPKNPQITRYERLTLGVAIFSSISTTVTAILVAVLDDK